MRVRGPDAKERKPHVYCGSANTMKWQVEGMRRGKPGRWTIEASTRESAQEKAEIAGVTLGRIEPIGQITSATVALALAPGARQGKSRRSPVGWIAACIGCAAVFGAGGYLLGSHFAPPAESATTGANVPAASSNDPTANANRAAWHANEGSRNKAEMSLSHGR